MHTFYLKIDGLDGDATEAHHRHWHKLSAYVLSDDAETEPRKRGRWNGAVHISRVNDYNGKSEKNAGLHYLNFELVLSRQTAQSLLLAHHKGRLPHHPADAILAVATDQGAECWQIEFKDVRIVEYVVSSSRQDDQEPTATISLKFQNTDTNLLTTDGTSYPDHYVNGCYHLNYGHGLMSYYRGSIAPGDK